MDREPDFGLSRNPRFDPTINLGHILTGATTLVATGLAMVTMYVNFRVSQADSSSRIKGSEDSILELRSNMKQITESQQQIVLTQQKLSLTLEYLAKQPPK